MRQNTLAEEGVEKYRKLTRREKFLNEMDQVIPWKDLCKAIEPFYPKAQVVVRWVLDGCCVFIFSSTGPTCPTRRWRKRCTIRAPCGSL